MKFDLVEAALATGFLTRWMPASHLALPTRDQKNVISQGTSALLVQH